MTDQPFISVVIATRNREALLAETLEALAGQLWPGDRFEILVADNGSTDGTRAVVRRAALRSASPRIHYRYVEHAGEITRGERHSARRARQSGGHDR